MQGIHWVQSSIVLTQQLKPIAKLEHKANHNCHCLSSFVFTYTTSISLFSFSLSNELFYFFFSNCPSGFVCLFNIVIHVNYYFSFSVFISSLSSQLYIKNKLFSLMFLASVVIGYKSWLTWPTAACRPRAPSQFMFSRLEIWRVTLVFAEVQHLVCLQLLTVPSACLQVPEQWPYLAPLGAPVGKSSHSTSVFKVFIQAS